MYVEDYPAVVKPMSLAEVISRLKTLSLTPTKRRDLIRAVTTDGLTEKNRERLAQFRDNRNVDLLLDLPRHLMRKAGKAKHAGPNQTLMVMHAVAIDILLSCPMRISNLAALSIERHLIWRGKGHKSRIALVVPGTEVKNRQPIEVDLPLPTSSFLDVYIRVWRSKLEGASGDALFPQSDGRPRLPSHFGPDICRAVRRETGIFMNAHLFRHLAAMLFLEQNPGEYETVRRLLGHRNLSTTTKFYAPFENWRAAERYDTVVLQKRRAGR